MVALYVDGHKVGTLADAERLLPQFITQGKAVDLRDDASGRKLGTVNPEPLVPWNPAVTKAELDRRAADPGGMPLAEFWKAMGVQ